MTAFPPPPPPLLAADLPGAAADYWAADFAAAAARPAAQTGGALGSDLPYLAGSQVGQYSSMSDAMGASAASSPAAGYTMNGLEVSRPTVVHAGHTYDDADPVDSFAGASTGSYGMRGSNNLGPAAVTRRDAGGGGTTWAALLLLMLVGGSVAFVARSHQRHGTLDSQLLLDDLKALADSVRSGQPGSAHRRVTMDEEAADMEGLQKELGSSLAAMAQRVPVPVRTAAAAGLAIMRGALASARDLVTARTVASAVDDVAWEDTRMVRRLSGETHSESGARSGGLVAAGDDGCGGSPQLTPRGPEYEWEGEKLSWESGQGLPPEKLPDCPVYRHQPVGFSIAGEQC